MPQLMESVGLPEIVRLLLSEARAGVEERRAEKREPFFHPVNLVLAKDPQRQFSCFSRDISTNSIGLLHCMPLELGEVVLKIRSDLCGEVHIRSEIVWCSPCGEGWYLSGARFNEFTVSARR